ncbi:hypothetical protein HOB95_02895, partial [bacterium]|nr:hypothetical protein [bacterium]
MKKLLLIALAITATLPIATQTSGLKLKLIRPTYKKVVRKVVPIVAAMGVSLSFYLLYVLNLNKKTVAKLTTANANLTRSQTKEVSQTASTLVVELEKVRAANAQLANDLK